MGVGYLLLLELWAVSAWGYIPPVKEHVLSEALLREVVDRMGRELEGYLDEPAYPQLRSADYQENPTVRDHEYLQHSSLWAFANSGEKSDGNEETAAGGGRTGGDGRQDTLPAYCDPPNPCPIGYTAEEGCLEEFENTASFSREYQAGQDCMCDSEHMFDCSSRNTNNEISESDIDRLVHHFHKWNENMSVGNGGANPYLEGERLPVAAKKGINIAN